VYKNRNTQQRHLVKYLRRASLQTSVKTDALRSQFSTAVSEQTLPPETKLDNARQLCYFLLPNQPVFDMTTSGFRTLETDGEPPHLEVIFAERLHKESILLGDLVGAGAVAGRTAGGAAG